jgi:hypothetical protein
VQTRDLPWSRSSLFCRQGMFIWVWCVWWWWWCLGLGFFSRTRSRAAHHLTREEKGPKWTKVQSLRRQTHPHTICPAVILQSPLELRTRADKSEATARKTALQMLGLGFFIILFFLITMSSLKRRNRIDRLNYISISYPWTVHIKSIYRDLYLRCRLYKV